MALKLYNTLSRKQEVFEPIDEKLVRMYSCGPTVYDHAHVGNLRAYICVDVLKRYLRFRGFDVMHITNITDVDDKIIKKAKEQKVPFRKITEHFTEEFYNDIRTIGIARADEYTLATEHIDAMVHLVEDLLAKGHAYKGDDGSIYFEIKSFEEYGKLSHTHLDDLKSGARVKQDSYTKENAQDFALWKSYDQEDGDVFWETSLGKGRPGWHLECSAMAIEHLGESFDIHAGGVDLIFPHHENEIAQSEASTGELFAKYWFHNEHLLVDGKKMSKSLGNFYTLPDLMKKGHKPSAIRYFLLSTNYRVQLNLTEDAIRACAQAVSRINDFVRRLRQMRIEGDESEGISQKIEGMMDAFTREMDDDLNISNALAHLFDFIRDINAQIDEGKVSVHDANHILEALKRLDEILNIIEEQGELDSDIDALVQEREVARKEKNFKRSDEIRDILKQKGIILEDSKDGVVWKRK